jgi:hypothetical protein
MDAVRVTDVRLEAEVRITAFGGIGSRAASCTDAQPVEKSRPSARAKSSSS